MRSLTRQLQAARLHCAPPPGYSHQYPPVRAAATGQHFVNALLAFLDDLGGFCGSRAAAWYSFAMYLRLCLRLSLVVSLKPGRPPAGRPPRRPPSQATA
eukprot:COSAG01_NODE_11745_length_1868_cov_2.210288_3_plen_98_part_01